MRHAVTLVLTLLLGSFGATTACTAPKSPHDDEGGPGYASLENARVTTPAEAAAATASQPVKTVFLVVMENHDWSSIAGSPSAPYINGTLLRDGAHAEAYTSTVHPSEPNYIWMEAGDALGIDDDDEPAANYRTTKAHLVSQLDAAGVSWKSYQEGISGDDCPLSNRGKYTPRHNPVVYFDDVTEGRQQWSPTCIAHVRPYAELARDLEADAAPRYVFITPDLCHDMHDTAGCETPDSVKNGDLWLSRELPKILGSRAFQDGGALFVTWDENEGGHGEPIGMIALSPFAKPGYASHVPYSHSSLLRTMQDAFGVQPYLRDAANATSLADLFAAPALTR